RYTALQPALPGVRLHYAVKALDHPDVLRAIASEDGWFDVASEPELDRLIALGVPGDRILFSNPIATTAERLAAVHAGVRTFVVDNQVDLLKTRDLPSDAAVLVRLAVHTTAVRNGIHIAGFSFHVGSQTTSAAPFLEAIAATLATMAVVEARHGIRFTILDIGGGFPVSYRDPEPSAVEIADAIAPALAPLA